MLLFKKHTFIMTHILNHLIPLINYQEYISKNQLDIFERARIDLYDSVVKLLTKYSQIQTFTFNISYSYDCRDYSFIPEIIISSGIIQDGTEYLKWIDEIRQFFDPLLIENYQILEMFYNSNLSTIHFHNLNEDQTPNLYFGEIIKTVLGKELYTKIYCFNLEEELILKTSIESKKIKI